MSPLERPPAPGTSAVPLSVLLIDDHRVFTDALRLSLETQADLRCVAVAHTADDGLACAGAVDADVVVLDLDLPDASGVDLIEKLVLTKPHMRIVVLTAHSRPDLAERALAAGAVGFLGKDGTLGAILDAVRGASETSIVVDHTLSRSRNPSADLTHREHDVLRALGQGRDARGIAAELGISLHTTRGHIKAALAKLGAHNQLNAVIKAEQLGLISVGSRY